MEDTHMGSRGTVRALAATGVLLGTGTAAALAQDDTVTQTSGQYITIPSTATDTKLTGDDVTKTLATPFPINYFGRQYTSLSASTNGFVQFGGASTSGCCSPIAGPLSGTNDGICAPAWTDLYVTSSTLTSTIWT